MTTVTARLADICDVMMGQSPPSPTYNNNCEGLPFFQGKVDFGDIYPNTRVYCSHPVRIAEPDDILISVRAPVGPTNIARQQSCIGRGLAALRARDKLNSKYLFYFLRYKEPQLSTKGRGSTFDAINREDLEDMEVPLLSMPKQDAIVRMIDQADRLCRLRRYALEMSESFLPAVFLKMFGDLRTNPNQYEIASLGDICDVRDGTHDSPKYQPNGYPLITSKNLVNGYVDLRGAELISKEDYDKANKRSKVHQGDILMPMIGTIGNPVIVEHEPGYAIKNVALIKFIDGSPSRIYIQQLLLSSYFDFITSRNSRGGTQKFIALGDIRDFPIPIPPVPLQKEFEDIVKKYNRVKSAHSESLRQAEHLFQSLLHQAFSEN